MLIVCTADPVIVATARAPDSGAAHWGQVNVLSPNLSLHRATDALALALSQLDDGESLCFSAHGSDQEIGDDRWHWHFRDIADLLVQHTNGYRQGLILVHACATRTVKFWANLAMELDTRNAQTNGQCLAGTWIYGYKRAVAVNASFPRPHLLGKQVDLRGMVVG